MSLPGVTYGGLSYITWMTCSVQLSHSTSGSVSMTWLNPPAGVSGIASSNTLSFE
jgi:hypothetical protein